MFTEGIIALDCVDSTNTYLKELAAQGAAEGTVVTARSQSAGRGTGGRSFFSPEGEGLYLSLLLRPRAEPTQLLTMTGWAAVAVREAIERSSGAPCQIKWLNDIYLNGKKLCGILTELSPTLDWVVMGVGVNLTQTRETFDTRGLGDIATSLAAEGYPVEGEVLLQAVLEELAEMYRSFPHEKEAYLRRYRAHCMTLGRQVAWQEGVGTATAVDGEFALVVEGRTVRAGQVQLI